MRYTIIMGQNQLLDIYFHQFITSKPRPYLVNINKRLSTLQVSDNCFHVSNNCP